MRVLAGGGQRGAVAQLAVIVGAVAVLAVAVVGDGPLKVTAPAIALVVCLTLTHRLLLTWRNLLLLLLYVILFIPIRRYQLPGDLPFALEPYRLVVALIVGGWLCSLLVDPRVRLRGTSLGPPLALLVVGVVGSEVANVHRFASVQSIAIKQLTFLVSFLLVVFVIASVARGVGNVDAFVRVLVAGGTIVAGFVVVESHTLFNVFNHLSSALPFLQYDGSVVVGQDGRGHRPYGSSQHPIAMGAALVMLIPLGIYLARRTGQKRWWLAIVVLAFGALATKSRTGILMLLVVGLVYVVQRPREMKRFWPALVPVLVAVHIVLPGTIGSFKNAFFPQGGLVASEAQNAGTRGSGRVADLGPGIAEWKEHAVFGEGYGTRVVDGPYANAPILDDQWLGSLLETGAVGVFAWGWLILRAFRRCTRFARGDPSPRGWLLVGVAASILAYGVGMFTYDAFAFTQVTFVFFVLLAIGDLLTARPRAPG